jgi:hypothetical protein
MIVSIAIANLSMIFWVIFFQETMIEQCKKDDPNGALINTYIVFVAICGATWLISFNMPFWMLAMSYWKMSYSLEELIRPFDREERPKCHKYLTKAITVSLCLIPSIWAVTYTA